MASFEKGVGNAVYEVVGGAAAALVVDILVMAGLVSAGWVSLFCLVNLIGTIAFTLALPKWGTVYTIGWLVGLWLMLRSGLVGAFDGAVYVGPPVAVLAYKIYGMFSSHT